MFDGIVAGYASDQAGRDSIVLAAVLAANMGSRLTVVFPYQPLLSSVPADAVEERVRKEVGALTAQIDGLAAPAFHWTPSPWPIHGLQELAEYEAAQLIVFGSARERVSDHLHVSLMERLVHGAPCAVAIAPPRYAERERRPLRRVGVGFSSSDEGVAVLHLAREFAERTGGSLDVIAGAGLEPALAGYAYSSPALPEVERELFQETEATLQRVTADLDGDVAVKRETIKGDPAEVLIERSRELDILMLGSRGYGPLRHALLGSVSARVMRQSRCPVVTLPRGVVRGEPLPTAREQASA